MYIVIGVLLVFMALAGSVLKGLPLTTSLVYLVIGVALGPLGTGAIDLSPLEHASLLEVVTEMAVIVSLFTAGLKLRVPITDPLWRPAFRLASLSMAITVALVTAAGVLGLGLPLGAAVILGAILAPTDPVLASDVQVAGPGDRDRLRFTLTGEASLNDGTAFPFMMLGLGLTGLHDVGAYGWRFIAVDLLWAVAGGLATGWLLGSAIGRLVVYLRSERRTAIGLYEFLTLGLIALAYGVAIALHAYGFLAVFTAGLALRRIERQATGDDAPADAVDDPGSDGDSADPERAPAFMARALLGFNEQLERLGEVALVILVGSMLSPRFLAIEALWFVPLFFLVIRPAAVLVGLAGIRVRPVERHMIGWFGVRGIGSLYYLMYAVHHGLPRSDAAEITAVTLTVVAVSIVVHGVSVTPLMRYYERRTAEARRRSPGTAVAPPGRSNQEA